jgi:propanol-preferring alcohol dehydrogenase
VCRTDLHLAEGDLAPHGNDVVPGHEIVGVVDALGQNARRFTEGERVGIAWLRSTCGSCRFCQRGDENLCVEPRFTGWDADGGYAEYAVVDERFAYRLPDGFTDEEAAPCCVQGSSAFVPCAERICPRAAASESTASAARRTSRRRWRWPRG